MNQLNSIKLKSSFHYPFEICIFIAMEGKKSEKKNTHTSWEQWTSAGWSGSKSNLCLKTFIFRPTNSILVVPVWLETGREIAIVVMAADKRIKFFTVVLRACFLSIDFHYFVQNFSSFAIRSAFVIISGQRKILKIDFRIIEFEGLQRTDVWIKMAYKDFLYPPFITSKTQRTAHSENRSMWTCRFILVVFN